MTGKKKIQKSNKRKIVLPQVESAIGVKGPHATTLPRQHIDILE